TRFSRDWSSDVCSSDLPRVVRAMIEKWALSLPFAATFFNRVGQVVGVPENARRLLELDEALLVFPEGTRGINKPFSQRYQLQERSEERRVGNENIKVRN